MPEYKSDNPVEIPIDFRSGVARGGAGGANAPPQIFVVPLLPKTPIGNRFT